MHISVAFLNVDTRGVHSNSKKRSLPKNYKIYYVYLNTLIQYVISAVLLYNNAVSTKWHSGSQNGQRDPLRSVK
jgi:hypothetical protein